jgi:hypothetical protein
MEIKKRNWRKRMKKLLELAIIELRQLLSKKEILTLPVEVGTSKGYCSST